MSNPAGERRRQSVGDSTLSKLLAFYKIVFFAKPFYEFFRVQTEREITINFVRVPACVDGAYRIAVAKLSIYFDEPFVSAYRHYASPKPAR